MDPWRVSAWSDAHLRTAASRAVAICEAAIEAGVDVAGTQFMVGGEPITAARRRVLEQAGGVVYPAYSASEVGSMANGCLAAAEPDDMHLFRDRFGVIQPGSTVANLPVTALLITTLSSTARLPLINASLGDQGVLSERACGCPLAQLGWTTHVHHIGSFEKLTSGGMTFIDSDVVAILERVLPDRFGGGPTDYQLAETEGERGEPVLTLRVHPRVGEIDDVALRRAFLDAISPGDGVEHVMGQLWRDAQFLRIARIAPEATAFGKIYHFRSAATQNRADSD